MQPSIPKEVFINALNAQIAEFEADVAAARDDPTMADMVREWDALIARARQQIADL